MRYPGSMADGALTLSLDDDLARRISEAAKKAGVSEEALAVRLLDQQLFDYGSVTWTGDDPRTTPSPPRRTDEPMYPLEEVLAEFDAELEKRLADEA